MILVSLVLKLLVSSRPLKLEGVLCIYVLLFHEGQAENLLTRCHSASSLFSVVFVFQKSYTGNILGIGRNKSQTSKYLTKLPEVRRGDRGGPQGGHTTKGCGLPLACATLW
jgi:hypothetical protein